MNRQEYIIAAADKSILKIFGVSIKGLNTRDLEQRLSERLHTLVRVIGVTGQQIEMDVYGIEPEQIRRDEQALLQAVSLVEGVTANELCTLAVSEKIVDVDIQKVPDKPYYGCARERWVQF
ncbi:hypothetical protein [uncultured Dysosmobacter sp.]|uniref:hypothetical protein n=1 Tax=uncultured Dysosmobacter sp. TaxID=2591384 RepID=UPI002628A5C6|nr:hypothetical protein [uncultured Dysosmobacter sp.]